VLFGISSLVGLLLLKVKLLQVQILQMLLLS